MIKFMHSGQKHDIVDPNLEALLTQVKAKRPLFEFQPDRARKDVQSQVMLVSVDVWMKGAHIGNISTNHKRKDREGNESRWFAITADSIKKDRGPRNLKVAKDLNKAVKIALEHLLFPETQLLGKKLIEIGFSQLDHLHDSVKYNLRDKVRVDSNSTSMDIITYFLEKARGTDPVVPAKFQSFDDHVYKLYAQYISASDLLNRHRAGSLYVVGTLVDGAYASAKCRDEMTYVRHETTYDMPIFMQEKITMLKMLPKHEPLDHVGVKLVWNDELDLFIITDGDTVTM